MTVRTIRPEELGRCQELFALAFDAPLRRNREQAETKEEEKILRWGAFSADGQLMSTLSLTPYTVTFDGHAFPMEGVGGVATLPQYRRTGGIRGIFETALPDMYQRGLVFSYLYPFSTAYYRKFGYELGCEANEWSIELSRIPDFDLSGSYRLVETNSGLPASLCAVANRMEARYNMAVHTSTEDWKENDPFAEGEYTYIYFNAQNEPLSFFTFRTEKNEEGRIMKCSRVICHDREGLAAVLAMLKRHAADYSRAIFTLPSDIRLDGLLPEWSFDAVRCKKVQRGMARIINVKEVLQAASVNGIRGASCVIAIRDEQIAQNNGHFRVTFDDTMNHVEQTEVSADISLDIQALTTLLIGRLSFDDLVWLDKVHINGNEKALRTLFRKKPLFIDRYF